MKNLLRYIFLFVGLLGCSLAWGQMVEASYKVSFNVIEAQVGDTVEIMVEVTPPAGWHVYSIRNEGCEISPILASLDMTKDASFKRIGTLEPIGDVKKRDDMFECSVWSFKGVALFKQKVVIVSKELNVKVEFGGQMCNDESCVPLFSDVFEVKGIKILN